MNYKYYKSFQVKNGYIDVFVMMIDGHVGYEMFITDYLSQSTSSASFTPEQFETFISFLDNLNDKL